MSTHIKIDRAGILRWHWSVMFGDWSGVGGWALTKRGARRAAARAARPEANRSGRAVK